MASLFPGFEYDIFISYRQKDNKGNRWVSEFVESLKVELEATFKEDISIYFDENPHDGLLETHDVDDSLRAKLKCLIFIPVISRTYCDPKSFAWEHEFKAFIEQASIDPIGLKVKLPRGNVATRVLPVKIHELEAEDNTLCESALGSVLRGVDFIYKSPGVNRPLLAAEEHPKDNLNKTYYRDQINKVANAIDEIIHSIRSESSQVAEKNPMIFKGNVSGIKKINENLVPSFKNFFTKKIILLFLSVLFCLSAAFAIFKIINISTSKKTIAVIPFTNPGNDSELGQFAIGSMDAIITKLRQTGALTVRSRVSTFPYLDTKLPLHKIRKDLRINYLVEINVSKQGNKLILWVGLTKTRTNKQLWADRYEINTDRLLPLFTDIVTAIWEKMGVIFSPEEIKNLGKDLTKNSEAYLNYLSGNARLFIAMGNKFVDSVSFISAIEMYDKAIVADRDFANAYAGRAIARSWGYSIRQLNASHIEKCWADIESALKLNKDLTDVQNALGFYYYYCKIDYSKALEIFESVSRKEPENYEPLFFMAMVYRKQGDWLKSQELIHRVLAFNPQEPLYLTNIGLSYTYLHQYDSALYFFQQAINVNPGWSASYLNMIEALVLKNGNTSEARNILDSVIMNTKGNQTEIKIMLDIFDRKYAAAFSEADKTGPEDFNIKGSKFIYQGEISSLLNNIKNAENYYNAALSILEIERAADSTNAEIVGLSGIAHAGLGNRDEAVARGKKALEIAILHKDRLKESNMVLYLARIYTMSGLYDKALEKLEYSLKNPSLISSKKLQIDPVWYPLHNLPEFKKIVNNYPDR